MRTLLTLLALGAVLAISCDEADEPGEPDGGTDADADSDSDTDSDQGDCGSPWGWYDETSGLCWQDPAHDEQLTWDAAIDYCDALVLGGHGDWRLPSISELRTFIRGCEATMPDGECGAPDEGNLACEGCAGCEGPGLACGGEEQGGLYFDADVVGGEVYQETAMIWSSTPWNDSDLYVWVLFASLASLDSFEKVSEGQSDTTCAALCIRDGL